MTNRKNLYGYHIQNGELTVLPEEAAVVGRIVTLYIAGGSYQGIADNLNHNGVPFSSEAPLWNKHKVKRLLENTTLYITVEKFLTEVMHLPRRYVGHNRNHALAAQ